MRRIAGFLVVASCLIGIAAPPASAATPLVIGVWPQSYDPNFTEIQAALGIQIPYFRGRLLDGQFDSDLVVPDAYQAAQAGKSLGLNIQPKTGSGTNRTGIRYTDISAQIRAGSGPYYDKLVSFANEVLDLPNYGEVPNYIQFHSEASTQAAPGVLDAHPYSGTGAEFKECYALVHELFDALGVTDQIVWQIVLSRTTYNGGQGGPAAWFPTDTSLYDLVGVDAYYRPTQWLMPPAAFDSALAFARAHGKKLWIDETGSDEGGPNNSATAKSAWFGSLRSYIEANLSDFAGVVFSHASDGGNWFLDSKLPAGRASPHYTGTSWNGWKSAVTALIAETTRTVSVHEAGTGTGHVTSSLPGISCPSDCTEGFGPGDAVTLTASAAPSSAFTGWTGDCSGTGPCNLVLDSDKDVTATFELRHHDLTVATDGGGTGSVTSDVGGIDCPPACVANGLVQSTHAVLTAAPDPGFALAGWSGGGCSGRAFSCDVTMDTDHTVTATFEPAVGLTVVLAGGGGGAVTTPPGNEIDCPPSCSHGFAQNGTVTLHAEPDANSLLTEWSGDCSGNTDCTVTMDVARNVTATFEPAFSLHVDRTGAGAGAVTSDVEGIDCGTDCDQKWFAGTNVTLHAADGPNATFDSWSGDCSGSGDCVVTMDQARSVTAAYLPVLHELSVTKNGSGTGTVTSLAPHPGIDCGATCAFDFQQGSSVVLHAVAAASSDFIGWSSGGCSGTADCTVSIDVARSVDAQFDIAQRLLTVTKAGAGSGVVTSNPGGIDCGATCSASYAHGTVVTLSAAPSGGSVFGAWTGGGCAGTGACIVTMDAAKSVTGTFNPVVTTTTLKDNDTAVAYNGWAGVADGAANGGSYRMSNVKNDIATWASPKTTSINWVTRTGPDQGKASVTIDGVNKGTVDLYSASPTPSNKVYMNLTNKTHTIVIKVLLTKNAASSGFNVSVDAFIVGATTTQESDTGILWNTWKSSTQALATDATYRSASAATATVKVTFAGTSIDWITTKGKGYGKASVKIDGVAKGTFDLYQSATAWHSLITFGGLSAGQHTMVIQVLGTKNAAATGKSIIVDGFVVHT